MLLSTGDQLACARPYRYYGVRPHSKIRIFACEVAGIPFDAITPPSGNKPRRLPWIFETVKKIAFSLHLELLYPFILSPPSFITLANTKLSSMLCCWVFAKSSPCCFLFSFRHSGIKCYTNSHTISAHDSLSCETSLASSNKLMPSDIIYIGFLLQNHSGTMCQSFSHVLKPCNEKQKA